VPRLFAITGLLAVLAGLALAWPLLRAAAQYQIVRGRVLDVLTQPTTDGRVRMAVAYEFTPPGRREVLLSYRTSDWRLAPGDDPVVDPATADLWQRTLPGRIVPVYVDVNAGADSAFMVADPRRLGRLKAEHGIPLTLMGLLLWIVGYWTRLRRKG
jgi:hypothetical protein